MEYVSETVAERPEAFLLTGAFRVVCRNHRFLTELAGRGLPVLVLCPESSREQVVAAVSRPGPAAETIAEVRYAAGTMDQESSYTPDVFAVLAEWQTRYRITGVFAMEETLVEPTGLVCDLLGVPSPGLRASRVCRSKYLQRGYLARFSPQAVIVPPGRRETVDLDAIKYPVVVKPAARHASSGVLSCDQPDEVAELLDGYSPQETVLIEQKITGREFSVESLVRQGRICFSSVTRKETTDTRERSFVELAHTVLAGPTWIAGVEVNALLTEANRQVLDALAFRDGVTHSEWRVTDAGEPYLMEIAARTPGDGLTVLYELACGQPMEPQIVRVALGEQVRYAPPRRYARQVYLEHPAGILRDVHLDWPGVEVTWLDAADLWPSPRPGQVGDPPALRSVLALKPPGSRLGPLESSDDRAVTFFVDADTEAGLDEIERRVRAAITLRVDPDGQDRSGTC